MARTNLQIRADEHATELRRALAQDLRRMREDAGCTRVAIAALAGVDPSLITRIESRDIDPTLETYARVAAALGASLATKVYPDTGPSVRDRHQVRIVECLLASLHPRWRATPEAAVRRPVRGWVDAALHDPSSALVVATEVESLLRRLEQLLRWSQEKAEALPSSPAWASWSATGRPAVSRLLVVRSTRTNREVARDTRRLLAAAYSADPRDALDALTGTAAWPGPAQLWVRLEGPGAAVLDPWRP
jgi:transcriptional regulator with XRE-family HTH domain